MKIIKLSFLMLASALLMVACGSKEQSSTTGWNLNDTEWGGFDRSSYQEQITGPGLVFIEGGSFQMGRVADESRFSWNNLVHTVTVSSFYIDETEVSNISYREFVYWMNRAYGEEYPELVKQIYPDTNVWRQRLSWVENFVENYFQCAMFNDYPVVGVTWEQASQFCKWRTDRVNEKILVDAGIIDLAQSELTGSEAFQTDVYPTPPAVVRTVTSVVPMVYSCPTTASRPRLNGSSLPSASSATPLTSVLLSTRLILGLDRVSVPPTRNIMVSSLPTSSVRAAMPWVLLAT